MNYTPGPWAIGYDDGSGIHWYKGEPRLGVVEITAAVRPPGFGKVCEASDVSEADAHLIAAAPDLLEALVAIVGDGPGPSGVLVYADPVTLQARAAIARATGSISAEV
jgi:hypothetical protein